MNATRTLRIAPALTGIPNIRAAAGVLSRLTVNRSAVLGEFSRPISPEDTDILPEHIPAADSPDNPFTRSVLGFLARTDELVQGTEWLDRYAGRSEVLDIPQLVGNLAHSDFREFTTHWSACDSFASRMDDDRDSSTIRVGWFLRDMAFGPFEYHDYGRLGEGRIFMTPYSFGEQGLQNNTGTRIMSLGLRGVDVTVLSVLGTIHWTDLYRHSLDQDASPAYGPKRNIWVSIDGIDHLDGKFHVTMTGADGKNFSHSYTPDDIVLISATQADNPETKDS